MPHEPLLAAILEGIGSTGRGGRPRETLLDPREPARRAPQIRVDHGRRRGPEGPSGKSRGEVYDRGGRLSPGESDPRRGAGGPGPKPQPRRTPWPAKGKLPHFLPGDKPAPGSPPPPM